MPVAPRDAFASDVEAAALVDDTLKRARVLLSEAGIERGGLHRPDSKILTHPSLFARGIIEQV